MIITQTILWVIFTFKNVKTFNTFDIRQSCVFNTLEIVTSSSEMECAFRCHLTNCKAFQLKDGNSLCYLYAYHEICQSDTFCAKVKVFVNSRYNNKHSADDINVRFKILNKNDGKPYSGLLSVYKIVNDTKATPLVHGSNNFLVMAMGKYLNSILILVPNGMPQSMIDNIMSVLTNGICKTYNGCSKLVDKITSVLTDVTFQISDDNIDFSYLIRKIKSNNWNVLMYTSVAEKDTQPIRNFLLFYGICLTKVKDSKNWDIQENICRSINDLRNLTCTA